MTRSDPRPLPLALHKSRFTARLQLTLATGFGIGGLYAAVLAYSIAGELGALISGLFAFTTICVAGAFAKAALEVLNHDGPWLVIDERGITDMAKRIGPIPWHEMRAVTLDSYENRIAVTFHEGSPSRPSRGPWLSLLFRWQNGGDLLLPLGGLRYDTGRLKSTLGQFHAAASRTVTNGSAGAC